MISLAPDHCDDCGKEMSAGNIHLTSTKVILRCEPCSMKFRQRMGVETEREKGMEWARGVLRGI